MITLPCPIDDLPMTARITFLGKDEDKERGKILYKHLHLTIGVLKCSNDHDWILTEAQLQRVR